MGSSSRLRPNPETCDVVNGTLWASAPACHSLDRQATHLHYKLCSRAELLVAEGIHRIHFHCPAGGNITGDQSHADEKEGDTGKGQRICGPNSIKQAGH